MRRYLLILTVLFAMLLTVAPASAKEPATPSLTLEQAKEMAATHSKALKSAEYDVERGDLVKDSAELKMMFAPTGPTTAQAKSAFTNYVQSDINQQMNKRSYEAEQDSLDMQTLQYYNNILLGLEKVKVLETQLATADWKYKVAVVSKRVGILDSLSFVQAESSLADAKSSLELARKSLSETYEKFNQMVGLWPEDRPVLVDQPVYDKLVIDNLETEVERAVVLSPSVWMSEKKIDLAKIARNLYNLAGTSSTEPYKTAEIDIEKAMLSASSTEEQTKLLVRSIYYKVVQLEDQYEKAQVSLKLAEENLRVAQVKYDVGMVTKTDVLTAEANLLTARQSILDILSQHQILSIAFKKPWAYS